MTPDDMEGRLANMADWFSQLTDAPAPVSSSQMAKDLRAFLLDYQERGRALERIADLAKDGRCTASLPVIDRIARTTLKGKSHD